LVAVFVLTAPVWLAVLCVLIIGRYAWCGWAVSLLAAVSGCKAWAVRGASGRRDWICETRCRL